MAETKFELILAILNKGFATEAIIAAKEAGAKGGTIMHARGTSDIGVQKKYGVVVTPEKEVVMILSSIENKDKIIEALYSSRKVGDKEKGIIFTLPVTSTCGLKYE